jgi:uncharacterized SAM-binding protein YcdF (DUF218 family)
MREAVSWVGSIELLVLGLLAGVVLLRSSRTAAWGRRWLTALAIAYLLMSTLPVPLLLAKVLTRQYRPLAPGPELNGVSMVVVLAGGSSTVSGYGDQRVGMLGPSTLARVLEGVRVFRMLPDGWIIATGPRAEASDRRLLPDAETMRSAMIAMGVPAGRVLVEAEARNTRDQAVNVGAMLRQHGTTRFVLVTTGIHMPRALAAFRAEGLSPVPGISMYGFEDSGVSGYLLPNPGALQLSQWVLHEYIGLAYYTARGWLK